MTTKEDDSNLKYQKLNVAVPPQASDWKNEHLESLGLYYCEKSSSLSDLLGHLRKLGSCENHSELLPEIVSNIINFINTIWNFSCDFEDCEYGRGLRNIQGQLRKLKREFSGNESCLRTDYTELLTDPVNLRIFNDWRSMMVKFLSWWDVFLQNLQNEEATKGSYTQLFLQFFMTCLLVPEIGKSRQGQMKINGIEVSGVPDIHFSRFSLHDCSNTVGCVTVTEVQGQSFAKKQCRRPSDEDSFNIHTELSSELLGRHGAELLLETKRSYFRPAVAGMICVATKVIFTYMDISLNHSKKMRGVQLEDINDKGHNDRSFIHYSRPYDVMDASDRSEMLKALFWFGCVQSSEFELYRL